MGLQKTFRLLARPVLVLRRTPEHDEVCLAARSGPRRLFTLPHPRKLQQADLRNDAFDAGNLFELERVRRAGAEGKTVVLYVLNALSRGGGVERRLALQFRWLRCHGVEPVLVCGRQEYAPLGDCPTLRWLAFAPHSQMKLIDLIRWSGASVVEFNMNPRKFLPFMDLEALGRWARTGCMIHAAVEDSGEVERELERLDYRCTSTKHANRFEHFETIPNVVDFPKSCPAFSPRARKALIIGRVNDEKLPTVKNFVELCGHYGLDYEIAGPVEEEKETTVFLSGIPKAKLLGLLDARRYLEEKGGEYLFVAGVGQVPLEAAAANLPALVSPHAGDWRRAVFLTEGNQELMRSWNCVIKKIPEEAAPGNAGAFFEAVDKARASGTPEPLAPFRIRRPLEATLSADEVWGRYLEILLGKPREKDPGG